MSQYIVRFFKENPFDKSEHAQNVQVLCDGETGEPFGVLETDLNLEGQIILSNQMESSWVSKKSKHIVVGDFVVFGEYDKYEGVVSDIVDNPDNYYMDSCLVTNIKCNYSNVPALAALYRNRTEPDRHVVRQSLRAKPYVVAKITDNSFAWEALKVKFNEFYEKNTDVVEIFNWWKKQFENKI
jgi:hypothetical protein